MATEGLWREIESLVEAAGGREKCAPATARHGIGRRTRAVDGMCLCYRSKKCLRALSQRIAFWSGGLLEWISGWSLSGRRANI
jgi:hypothetical protein